MPGIVEHLETLTGSRDRELLEVGLVGAFRDLIRPRSAAIYRVIGEGDQRRWISRARIGADDTVATADPPWTEFDALPVLSAHPERLQALEDHAVVVAPGGRRAVFPITSEREVIGVLEIESDAPIDESARSLVVGVLRIYRNFLDLLDYSERDTLTGLLNRKTFDDHFLRLTSSMKVQGDGRRGGGTAGHWLAVIDIDHFKRVNDTFGHLIGDEVLLLLSRLMRSCFRSDDRLYRFGGEEFVVVMRCHDGAGALLAFERLRQAVEAFRFPQVGTITVSVGITDLRQGDVPSGAFERADKAVYYAKTNGRNRVCDHAVLIASGALADDAKIGDVELF